MDCHNQSKIKCCGTKLFQDSHIEPFKYEKQDIIEWLREHGEKSQIEFKKYINNCSEHKE